MSDEKQTAGSEAPEERIYRNLQRIRKEANNWGRVGMNVPVGSIADHIGTIANTVEELAEAIGLDLHQLLTDNRVPTHRRPTSQTFHEIQEIREIGRLIALDTRSHGEPPLSVWEQVAVNAEKLVEKLNVFAGPDTDTPHEAHQEAQAFLDWIFQARVPLYTATHGRIMVSVGRMMMLSINDPVTENVGAIRIVDARRALQEVGIIIGPVHMHFATTSRWLQEQRYEHRGRHDLRDTLMGFPGASAGGLRWFNGVYRSRTVRIPIGLIPKQVVAAQ